MNPFIDQFLVPFALAIISSMLIDNVVLSRFYGICPFLGVSKKPKSALGMGVAVVAVIIVATAICWPIYQLLKLPEVNLPYMDTVVYILVIASLVQLVGIFIKKYSPGLYKSLGIYLPLITTNCAVLGVVQSNSDQGLNFANSMANAIGTSVGFLIVIFVFSCIRVRFESSDTPKAFKGVAIALITASIMALAFFGLTGMAG